MHKVSYNEACRPKSEGVVGLKNLFEHKKVYGLKLVWKIHNTDNLWAKWMRGRYLKDNLWTIKLDNNASII